MVRVRLDVATNLKGTSKSAIPFRMIFRGSKHQRAISIFCYPVLEFSIEYVIMDLYCNEGDSIGHTFIDCHFSKSFFSNVLEWFNREHATSYSPSTEEFLFGKLVMISYRSQTCRWKSLIIVCYLQNIISTVKNWTKNKSTLMNLSNELPSNFALKAFHSSISLIFIIHLVHI